MGVFLFVILPSLLFTPICVALSFYTQHTNHLEAYLPVNEKDTFQIIFTHSIHLTDVVEIYEVTADHRMKQSEIIFEQFGIGMPSNAEEGETFVYEDGKYHIQHMNHRFTSLNIRNGKTVSNHRLIWGEEGEKMVRFNEYFTPGARLTVKIDKLSIWQCLKGEKIDE